MVMQVQKIERANPLRREEKRWYLTKAPGRSIDLDVISKEIEKRSTVSRPDVMAVLYSLVELLPEHLISGDSVRLGAFGSFRASISSLPAPTPEEVNANMVKGVKIGFLAGAELKKAIALAKYKVV